MKRPPLTVNIHVEARDDLDALALHIALENPEAAARLFDDFDADVDRLTVFPALGQVWRTNHPETLATVRRLVMRDFRVSIFYRPTSTTLEVLRVLHHAQHVPPLLDDLDE